MAQKRVRQFWRARSRAFAEEYTAAFVAEHKQKQTDQTLRRAIFLDKGAFRALLSVGQILKKLNPALSFQHTPVEQLAKYIRNCLGEKEAEEDDVKEGLVSHAMAMNRRARQRTRMLAEVKRTAIRVAAMSANGAIQSFDPAKLPGSGRPAAEPSLTLMFGENKNRPRKQIRQIVDMSAKERSICRHFLTDWSRYKRFITGMHQHTTWVAATQQMPDPVRVQLCSVTPDQLTRHRFWIHGDLHLVRSGSVSFLYLGITQNSFVDGTAAAVSQELERGISAQLVARGQKQAAEIWKQAMSRSVETETKQAIHSWLSSMTLKTIALIDKLRDAADKHVQKRLPIHKAITEWAPPWTCVSKRLMTFYHQHLCPTLVPQKALTDKLILFEMLYRTDPDPFEDGEYEYESTDDNAVAAWSGTIEPYPMWAPKALGSSDDWCSNTTLQKVVRSCVEQIHEMAVIEIMRDLSLLCHRLSWLLTQMEDQTTHERGIVNLLMQKVEAQYGPDLDVALKKSQARSEAQMETLGKCHERWAWQQHERLAFEIRNHKELDDVIRAIRCRFDTRCKLMLREIKLAQVDPFFGTFSGEWANLMSHVAAPFKTPAITTAAAVFWDHATLHWRGHKWNGDLQHQLDLSVEEASRALTQAVTKKWPLTPPDRPDWTREPVLVSDVLQTIFQSQVYASVLDQVIVMTRQQKVNQ